MIHFPIEQGERNVYDYAAFRELYDQKIQELDRSEAEDTGHLRLNVQRMKRWERSYIPSEEVLAMLAALPAQHWVLIGEDWCADVAQNLPILANWVSKAPQIRLSIVKRDENPDLMDLVLTNGTRSIPKLVGLNANSEIVFEWGPRPKAIQDLFYRLRDQGIPKTDIMPQIHKEYALNKGKALEQDLLELLLVEAS